MTTTSDAMPNHVTYAVQRYVEGEWQDAGDYPNTESTTITHARERTRYDGVPARAIVRETDTVLAEFQADGHHMARTVRRVRR